MATGIALALPDNESGGLVGSAQPTYRHFSSLAAERADFWAAARPYDLFEGSCPSRRSGAYS